MQTTTRVLEAPKAASPYSRKNPFLAELTRHDRLTGHGSLKDTRHFVLNLAGSGLTYTPGDSLGAFGRNSPELAEELIELLSFDPETEVNNPTGQLTTFRETLRRDYTINRANRKIMASLVERMPQGEQRNRLMEIVDNSDALSQYIDTRDYVDILREFDEARFESPAAFLAQLSPIVPRLYSIASSLQAEPGEAHLCITVVRYESHGRAKKGLASGFFADHSDLFVKNIPVYVQESRTFRLPKDAATDIIMCGPGVGVAPFRAFLKQRVLDGATGRNWLFFGEQHRATDFLYGEEFQEYHRNGKLHRLDLAFSRDQSYKIYVQHRMLEQAKELWKWLQQGAHFYVCGDARHMAKDVHQTLIAIAQQEGGLGPEAAADYVNITLMKTEKRYLRDVY
ncbi:MAG TPA: sulfite reductase subunit alpha [Candidatus Paceibacterota bacterium]|nr:sulfite reductase subunit alpha [Verrucomicrobiota bacterium]HSA08842.1 sulfite reductase subunit alpha [Candidatus Paceibacterota bacterium]